MTKQHFLTRLSAAPMLCDGAFGTQLMAAGLPSGVAGILWNIDHPEVIESIHRAYREAGCQFTTTNTFQGSRTALANHGLEQRVIELNYAGAALARRAAGDEIVLANVGPFSGFLEPLGDTTVAQLKHIFQEQFIALRAGTADVALIETMSDMQEAAIAIKAAQTVAQWPIITTFTFEKTADEEQFRTMMGTTIAQAIGAAIDAGADVVGANCGTSLDLDDYLRLGERLVKAAGNIPVMLQPNAGAPIVVDGKTIHPTSPQKMASYVPRFVDLGIRIIGGCCGTTPAHMAAMKQALEATTAKV